jgi:osmotically-inducible protein OsmY
VPQEHIKLIVENSGLTLFGEVDKHYHKVYAQRSVENIVGLAGVCNNIIVKTTILVSQVKKKIIEEFKRNAHIDANNIEIEVFGNVITLKGKVKNFDEYKEAIISAWSTPGIEDVIDKLRIEGI